MIDCKSLSSLRECASDYRMFTKSLGIWKIALFIIKGDNKVGRKVVRIYYSITSVNRTINTISNSSDR